MYIQTGSFRPGSRVRIHGRRYIVGAMQDFGRQFTDEAGKTEILSTDRILSLIRAGKLTSDAEYHALSPEVAANLQRDFGVFDDRHREIANARCTILRAIIAEPVRYWDDRKAVSEIVDRVHAESEIARKIEKPSFRVVRSLFRRWIAAGHDIRALLPDLSARGNRTARYPDWVYEEVEKAIDRIYATQLKGSIRATVEHARRMILVRAKAEGLSLPGVAKRVLGRKVVENCIHDREEYDLLVKREGRAEADRVMNAKGPGPSGTYPLGEVETDHGLLDVIVVDPIRKVVLGRPWLTILIDRWSRMVTGFHIGFDPPGWTSVQNALANAVMPKDELLKKWAKWSGKPFAFDWPVWGPPDFLFTDRGAEFLSYSIAATEAALNMKVVQLPRKTPWKKGRVEANFRALNQKIIHLLPGTTKSNVKERDTLKSEESACLSLEDLTYLVLRFFVDVHNRTVHPGTSEIPAVRWLRDIAENIKAPPDAGIVKTLVGTVVVAKMTDEGLRHKGLRWNSNEFQALRNRVGLSADIVFRIDPLNLKYAQALDPDNHEYVQGELRAESEIEHYSLAQYDHLRKRIHNAKVYDPDYEEKIARAYKEIFDLIDERIGTTKVVSKAAARFATTGRKPVEHVHGTRIDPEASTQPVGTHDMAADIKSPAPTEFGPYRHTVLMTTDPYPPRNEDGSYEGEWQPPLPPETPVVETPRDTPIPPTSPLAGRRRKV